MESTENMDTSPSVSELRTRILRTELPTNEDVKETLQERYGNSNEKEDEKDDETDRDALSDCDSDVEGMENLWDALIRSNEPYGNTIEHLEKILEALPRRIGTRPRREVERFDQRVHVKKQLEKIDNILNSHLVDPDIDQMVLMQNLERMRINIKNIIRKKGPGQNNRDGAINDIPTLLRGLEL